MGYLPHFLSHSVQSVTLILLMISFVATPMGSSQNLLVLLPQPSRCCLCLISLSLSPECVGTMCASAPHSSLPPFSLSATRHPSLNCYIYKGDPVTHGTPGQKHLAFCSLHSGFPQSL